MAFLRCSLTLIDYCSRLYTYQCYRKMRRIIAHLKKFLFESNNELCRYKQLFSSNGNEKLNISCAIEVEFVTSFPIFNARSLSIVLVCYLFASRW